MKENQVIEIGSKWTVMGRNVIVTEFDHGKIWYAIEPLEYNVEAYLYETKFRQSAEERK